MLNTQTNRKREKAIVEAGLISAIGIHREGYKIFRVLTVGKDGLVTIKYLEPRQNIPEINVRLSIEPKIPMRQKDRIPARDKIKFANRHAVMTNGKIDVERTNKERLEIIEKLKLPKTTRTPGIRDKVIEKKNGISVAGLIVDGLIVVSYKKRPK